MHVIWDWNGTLLDDTEAAFDTLNIMLVERGCAPIEMPFYLDNFGFPVRPFYDRIGIVAKNEDEWNYIAREYHEVYLRQAKSLNREALAALERVKAAGCGQSILSALRQDLLETETGQYGVRGYFDYLYGTNNLDGASKLTRARELLARLEGEGVSSGGDCVMIGDAIHDKEVADELGIRCILCAQGSHAAWRLRAIAPTADTLVSAVDLALATNG